MLKKQAVISLLLLLLSVPLHVLPFSWYASSRISYLWFNPQHNGLPYALCDTPRLFALERKRPSLALLTVQLGQGLKPYTLSSPAHCDLHRYLFRRAKNKSKTSKKKNASTSPILPMHSSFLAQNSCCDLPLCRWISCEQEGDSAYMMELRGPCGVTGANVTQG